MPGFVPQEEDTSIRDSLAMRQMGATISPKKIDKALKPYNLENARVKGKSDTQLYAMAERAAVKWWQRQQNAKISARNPGKQDTAGEKKAKAGVTQKVEKAMNRIPDDFNARAQERAKQNALDARQAKLELLRGTGLYNIQPPTYAMTSVANLKAWINRQIARRNSLANKREDFNR